ncbi:PspA/IM30 family protein [Streptomyces sp. FH025]|uniref:PspA/IM30 family protein n=1 Tax=Streptomyces sp. FH025 TaxID=2815937 RepID=UPI001A9D553A|nr:PspA/IM30 family protein [Streptomyces sp. FH025]MBO1414563.1 PspA/IM30 family protein [Streptomyces sp. FH025]
MAGIASRIAELFRIRANQALDRAEDPREVLDYAHTQQLELLQKVRRGLADVATSRKRVELQIDQLRTSAGKLEEQAQQALAAAREDLAREALARRAGVQNQVAGLEEQRATLRTEEEKLTAATQRLEARVEDFRLRKEVLKAEYTRAETEAQIGEAVSGVGDVLGDVGAAVLRAQDRTEQLRARAAALDELMASGALEDATVKVGPDEVRVELERISTDQDVERELKRLKAQLPAAPAARTQEEKGARRAESGGESSV